MGVVEQSHESVESYLSVLDDSYGSFPINQRTLAVSTGEYERECERASAGRVDLYTKVVNDDAEVLHLRRDDEVVLPSTRVSDVPFEPVLRERVEDATGLSCTINGVDQATILGVVDTENDRDAVYRLAVVFEASPLSGQKASDAVWHKTAAVPELVAP